MHIRLSQGSLRRIAESMIDDFGAGAEAEVEMRIARAATQNLPTIADSWRRVKRLLSELRHGADGDNGGPSNL